MTKQRLTIEEIWQQFIKPFRQLPQFKAKTHDLQTIKIMLVVMDAGPAIREAINQGYKYQK